MGNKPEPMDRGELFEVEEDWYSRDVLKRRAYKLHMDPDDEYEEYEEDDEDGLAKDETKTEICPEDWRGSMDLATDHKK